MKAWTWCLSAILAVACGRELDPAACPTRFDVQRDKIIRTEESQEMGAHYISELDVGARDECLRLCCETDRCDVFVYEEKSPGSCYLFNCGPPEDFRCKFTAHGNFSSGVLAISRRLAELQDLERLTQHERDLANLRVQTTTTTKAPTTSAPTIPPTPRKPPEPPQPPPRRCSRYQFECHSGGECIAVYNACDGIPQCADGSDEAPELGCPAQHTQPPQIFTPPKMLENVADNSLSVEAQSEPRQEQRPSHWPHRLVQAQSPIPYAENAPSSHIFSHKGGLIQESDSSGMSPNVVQQYPAFEAPWQRRQWNAQSPGMDNMNVVNAGAARSNGYSRYREWSETEPQRAWPVPQIPPRESVPDMPLYMPPKTMPETPMVYSSQQETLRDSPKKGFDLVPKKYAPEPPHITEANINLVKTTTSSVQAEVAAQKPKIVNNASAKKEVTDQTTPPSKISQVQSPKKSEDNKHSIQHERFEMTQDDHDGLNEHPPAAVLLLILGILMTTVMAVMLGCRLRLARRRMRRGKSPFAHDADYLVNGMYL